MSWIGTLPGEVRAALLEGASVRTYPRNALLYGLTDQPGGLFLITAGSARQYFGRADGRSLLLRICREGESLGQTAITDGQPAPLFAEARTPLKTLFVPVSRINQLRQRHGEIEQALAREATRTIRQQWRLIESLAFLDLRERLIRRLQFLVEHDGAAAAVEIEIDISQFELAAMLGASRPAMNRVLRDLAAQEIVRTEFRKICIDRARIIALAAELGTETGNNVTSGGEPK